MTYSLRVNEIFSSIEGEGIRAGELTTFVRFYGCNMKCSYCDSQYACTGNDYKHMYVKEIVENVESFGNKNVTLTGGEPLIQLPIKDLINSLLLNPNNFSINIETNGSINVKEYIEKFPNVIYTVDYKCPSSDCEHLMNIENLRCLRPTDVLKFVVGSREDLERAYDVCMLSGTKAKVYLSPVFGKIEPVEIVKFMKEKCWQGVRVQLQIHKFIWDPNERGV